jgi:hypothetical protein
MFNGLSLIVAWKREESLGEEDVYVTAVTDELVELIDDEEDLRLPLLAPVAVDLPAVVVVSTTYCCCHWFPEALPKLLRCCMVLVDVRIVNGAPAIETTLVPL